MMAKYLIGSRCMHCRGTLLVKDIRTRRIRTVFGKIAVSCRRYIRCTCQGGRPSILWPLGPLELPGSTPELSYLLAKWGSILPYGRAAENARRVAADFRRCSAARDASPPQVLHEGIAQDLFAMKLGLDHLRAQATGRAGVTQVYPRTR
jgi:hypothetical protein